MFTNIRQTTPPSRRACLLLLGRDCHTAIFRVKFLRNHRTNTSPSRGAQSERRKSELGNSPTFPKRQPSPTCDFLSYENDIQRVARRVVVRNSASVIRTVRAENLQLKKKPQTEQTDPPRRARRAGIFFFLLIFWTILSNRTNEDYFAWLKNVPLKTSWSRKFALICCTFPPNIRKSNEPTKTLVHREKTNSKNITVTVPEENREKNCASFMFRESETSRSQLGPRRSKFREIRD